MKKNQKEIEICSAASRSFRSKINRCCTKRSLNQYGLAVSNFGAQISHNHRHNAPWYVTNDTLRHDLNVPHVRDEIKMTNTLRTDPHRIPHFSLRGSSDRAIECNSDNVTASYRSLEIRHLVRQQPSRICRTRHNKEPTAFCHITHPRTAATLAFY